VLNLHEINISQSTNVMLCSKGLYVDQFYRFRCEFVLYKDLIILEVIFIFLLIKKKLCGKVFSVYKVRGCEKIICD